MQITASMVNALREKTGVGMMQCKKALTETEGDVEKAVELLRKQGAAVAAKRADRESNEGSILLTTTATKAVMAEVNCETDFVANSDDFKNLVGYVTKAMQDSSVTTIESLLAANAGELDLNGRFAEMMAKLGEKITVRRMNVVTIAANEVVYTYSHNGGRAGAIVKLAYEGTPSDAAELNALAKDMALQVVAFDAVSIDETGVPAEIIAKERDIAKEQVVNEGKTKPEFVDRQVDGRIKKYLQGICLESQGFLRDPKVIIKDHVEATGKKLGLSSLKITEFVKYELGK